MYPEVFLLIWNQEPWTQSDLDLLDKFSDQTILCSVRYQIKKSMCDSKSLFTKYKMLMNMLFKVSMRGLCGLVVKIFDCCQQS